MGWFVGRVPGRDPGPGSGGGDGRAVPEGVGSMGIMAEASATTSESGEGGQRHRDRVLAAENAFPGEGDSEQHDEYPAGDG